MFLHKPNLWKALVFGAIVLLNSCGGSGANGSSQQNNTGYFVLESTNLGDGAVWQLNKLIELKFYHAIDMDSVSFATVIFHSADTNLPVTGSFEVDGEDPTLLYFRPSCPNSEGNDNGGFLPGGVAYSMTLPSSSAFGAAVIRDRDGRGLQQGVVRNFTTPKEVGGGLFVDYIDGPPQLHPVDGLQWPWGLNFMSDHGAQVRFQFNQALDVRRRNLNSDNLYVLYADGEVGSSSENTFPSDNKLPGHLRVERNCVEEGAIIVLEVAGVLPPNRKLQAVVARELTDLVGQRNFADLRPPAFATPTLAEVLQMDQVNWSQTAVADEIPEFFESSIGLDLTDAMPLPFADVEDGFVQASFGFPGEFTTKDFYWNNGVLEMRTNAQVFVTDANNTTHTVINGVLNCRNFYLDAASEIRGRGDNPLVIYATGEVEINGVINVSGNDAVWPTGLGSPTRPEGGAHGECGGGRGGTSSQETTRETLRGMSGEGAWGFAGSGGQGGEGGFNQQRFVHQSSNYEKESVCNTSAGGGGGTFARTENVAVYWTRWGQDDRMEGVDRNYTMDHNLDWNTATDPRLPGQRFVYAVHGGEAGMRGGSWGSAETDPLRPNGVYGMEDEQIEFIWDPLTGNSQDGHKDGNNNTFNQRFSEPWDDPVLESNPFSNNVLAGETMAVDDRNEYPRMLGHPTRGADGGLGGPSIFTLDGNTGNDFWGVRVNNDGSVSRGELLVPWAGAGGGASGDMALYVRGDGGNDPVVDSFPDPQFPNGTTQVYRKGGPGGGGGGQVMIQAIGNITIGAAGRVLANGGDGVGGESIGWTRGQVSGSGGGSGGHIVIGTAAKLDLSAIEITDGNQNGDQNWTIQGGGYYEIPIAGVYFTEVFQAIGGRRGWAMSQVNSTQLNGTGGVDYDGNDTYAVGRGGAGGNGVIQIHVPNPATDIVWPSNRAAEIQSYLYDGNPGLNPLNRDRVEEMLRIFAAPQPYSLVSTFSAQSMVRSKWIDTGVAEIRQPGTGSGVDYPNYADPVFRLEGIDPQTGRVLTENDRVQKLFQVTSGATAALNMHEFELRIPSASSAFLAHPHLLYQPNLLRGYGFQPNSERSHSHRVVGAAYDRNSDILTLLTDPADGNLLVTAGRNWSLQPHFFRIATSGAIDVLGSDSAVYIQFQGAEVSPLDFNSPGDPLPGPAKWTSDLGELEGLRFLRYQILFDLDAELDGVDLSSPRPSLHHLKIPLSW